MPLPIMRLMTNLVVQHTARVCCAKLACRCKPRVHASLRIVKINKERGAQYEHPKTQGTNYKPGTLLKTLRAGQALYVPQELVLWCFGSGRFFKKTFRRAGRFANQHGCILLFPHWSREHRNVPETMRRA